MAAAHPWSATLQESPLALPDSGTEMHGLCKVHEASRLEPSLFKIVLKNFHLNSFLLMAVLPKERPLILWQYINEKKQNLKLYMYATNSNIKNTHVHIKKIRPIYYDFILQFLH